MSWEAYKATSRERVCPELDIRNVWSRTPQATASGVFSKKAIHESRYLT